MSSGFRSREEVASANITSQSSPGQRKGTRASVKNRDDEELAAGIPPPRRAPKKRRRSPSLSEEQIDDSRRPKKINQADKPADNRAASVVDEPSLVFPQDDGQVTNDHRSEKFHSQFGDFTIAELEAGRLASAALGYPLPVIEGENTVDHWTIP